MKTCYNIASDACQFQSLHLQQHLALSASFSTDVLKGAEWHLTGIGQQSPNDSGELGSFLSSYIRRLTIFFGKMSNDILFSFLTDCLSN